MNFLKYPRSHAARVASAWFFTYSGVGTAAAAAAATAFLAFWFCFFSMFFRRFSASRASLSDPYFPTHFRLGLR